MDKCSRNVNFFEVLENNFKNNSDNFEKMSKISRIIISEVLTIESFQKLENYFGKFREKFQKMLTIKSFRQVSKIISLNFEKNFRKFREIQLKFLRNILKIFQKISVNFENYCAKNQELILKF